jgi:spoIIIJ-associated protein
MNKEDLLSTLLEEIFKHLKEDPDILLDTSEKDRFTVDINGDNLNFLIGYRGQSLDALQNVISLALLKEFNEYTPVTVDINGYKRRKIDRIKDDAMREIDKVRFEQKEIELSPMNSWERRQVHMLVSEYDDIVSESTGERRERRIVLKLKK